MEDLAYTPKALRDIFKINKITGKVKRKYGLSKKASNESLYKVLNNILLCDLESDSDPSSDYVESDDDF